MLNFKKWMWRDNPTYLYLKNPGHCVLICAPLYSDLRSVTHTLLPAKPVTPTRSGSGCWAKYPLLWLVQAKQITIPGSLRPSYLLSELALTAIE